MAKPSRRHWAVSVIFLRILVSVNAGRSPFETTSSSDIYMEDSYASGSGSGFEASGSVDLEDFRMVTPVMKLAPIKSGTEVSCDARTIEKVANLQCFKGDKGDKGDAGDIGPMGPPGTSTTGEKGDKGDTVVGPRGNKGERGEIGLPGLCSEHERGPKGQKGEPGSTYSPRGITYSKSAARFSGAVVYYSRNELRKIEPHTKPGAIAYLKSENQFFGRVREGWAPFLMGDTVSRKSKSNPDPWQKHPTAAPSQKRPKSSTYKARALKDIKTSSLRLIALNEPWTGHMDGIHFINYQCQKEAYTAGISAVFRAFLSSPRNTGTDIRDLVKNPHEKILNIRNETIFLSWHSMFKRAKLWELEDLTKSISPKQGEDPVYIYSFNGGNVITDDQIWEMNMVWHGSFENGVGSFTGSCKSWTSGSSDTFGLAGDFLFNHTLSQEKMRCNASLVVFCIEVPELYVRKHVLEVLELPANSTKVLQLTEDDHRQVLQKYDEEWAAILA